MREKETYEKKIAELTAQLVEWKQHAAESDKEFNQLEDWLIGNADWDEKGLINRAEKCKERIRDLIAAEAQLSEFKESKPLDDLVSECLKELHHASAQRTKGDILLEFFNRARSSPITPPQKAEKE